MEYMSVAISLAKKAAKKDETPVGAVIVKEGIIIAKGYNNRHSKNNILGHAEIITLMKAEKKLKSWRLQNCEMYVTLKPCELCEKVIKAARISKVYYLLDKQINKKEYNRTKIEKLFEYDTMEYREILSNFFINKR